MHGELVVVVVLEELYLPGAPDPGEAAREGLADGGHVPLQLRQPLLLLIKDRARGAASSRSAADTKRTAAGSARVTRGRRMPPERALNPTAPA